MSEIDKLVPNKFAYYLRKDDKLTGNFEVTLFKSEDDLDDNKNGVLIHSKAKTKEFPFTKDYDKFLKTVTDFAKNNKPIKSKRVKKVAPCIESDDDFETKGLSDMDINELDKMEDKRPSPFWKKSWGEVFVTIIVWAVVVYINECNYLNPHDPNYIFANFKLTYLS